MPTKAKALKAAQPTTEPEATPAILAPAKPSRVYLIDKVDEASGEVSQVLRFRYLPGHPR